MIACLDSWAILEWSREREPSFTRVEALLEERPVVSWVNLVEVYSRTERSHGRPEADDFVADLRDALKVDLPTPARMVEAARLKARASIALADCFAAVTAAAHQAVLLTGDPELIDFPDPPCRIEDLRPRQGKQDESRCASPSCP